MSSICAWPNLWRAWSRASKGKRGEPRVAAFEHQVADRLLQLQDDLLTGCYQPGAYTHFYIHEPKRRRISAAPFRDRVVHHALCNVIEPAFERRFINDSYANRKGMGTHRAVARFSHYARQYRYVLRMDIVKHFPSIDHRLLIDELNKTIADKAVMELIAKIIASGGAIFDQEYSPQLFPGDDLLALCRPRGLPIGNLTSQFWSNCYLHPLDVFVKRKLSSRAYIRYVDDFAVFADDKATLWLWKQAIREKLASLRLCFHEHSAQVVPVKQGVPWLGFVIYPHYRRVKARKVVRATRHLGSRFAQWQRGEISFAEFDASIQGWINHVRYADSWGLRRHVLDLFTW